MHIPIQFLLHRSEPGERWLFALCLLGLASLLLLAPPAEAQNTAGECRKPPPKAGDGDDEDPGTEGERGN